MPETSTVDEKLTGIQELDIEYAIRKALIGLYEAGDFYSDCGCDCECDGCWIVVGFHDATRAVLDALTDAGYVIRRRK